MTTENIIVEVKDTVATTISPKLKEIAAQAKSANTEVGNLNKTLKSVDGSKLTTTGNAAAASISKIAVANQNLATAQAKTATAMAQAQAATAGIAAATSRAAAEADKAALATLRLQTATDKAAQAAQRLSDSRARAQKSLDAAGEQRALEVRQRLEAVLNRTTTATEKYTMSAKAQAAAMRGVPAQITDIVVSLQGGQRPLTVLLQQGGQLKDMFGGIGNAARALATSLMAMITPWTLLAAAVAGFGVAVGMVENQMRIINGLVAQFAVSGRGSIDGTYIQQLRVELTKLPGISKSTATAIIQDFANIRNVGGANLKQVSMLVADYAKATGTDAAKASQKLAEAMKDPLKGAIALDEQLDFLTVKQFKQIDAFDKAGKSAEAQKIIIEALTKRIKGLAEEAMTPLEKATFELSNKWNKFTGELSNNSVFQIVYDGLVGLVNILSAVIDKLNVLGDSKAPPWLQDIAKYAKYLNPVGMVMGPLALAGGAVGSGAKAASTPIAGNANIRARAASGMSTDDKLTKAGIKNKPKSDHTEENRATSLAKVNAQLDNQFKLQQMLGPERDKTEQWNRIEETMIGKKIKLTDAETASIKAKIAMIVDNAKVSEAMNRIYEEAKGPQEAWNATITASSKLLQEGSINQEQFNKAMLKGEETFSNIVNPLREYMRDLEQELQLTKLTTAASEDEGKIMGLRNKLTADGNVLDTASEKAIRAKLAAIRESKLVQDAEAKVLGDTVLKRQEELRLLTAIATLKNKGVANGGISAGDAATQTDAKLTGMGLETSNLQINADARVQIYKDMNDQINQMEKDRLINEQDASNLRFQIWRKEQDQSLNSAQSFFGSLASLQSSSNKKLATIGKAAAISNAIIDTYKSATGAYASMSSIPYVGPALGAAAAAAAIAAGMANVQAIRSQGTGFMAGGYTGNGPTDAVAGQVHGKEFVMNAPATAAIGPANLQALQDGSASVVQNSQGSGGSSGGGDSGAAAAPSNNVRIVNVMDPALVGEFMNSPEGEQVFMNAIRKNPSAIRQTLQNG